MTLEPGQQLLHYRLTEKLGEGGMGVVWRGVDTTLDRPVAIKILPEHFAADPERLARFEREAKLLASLNHPNIATVHGLHEVDGRRFIAMELVEGEDLAACLARGPMDVEQALRVCAQVAAALEAAHAQGVVHRDLKPANVVLTPDGVAKVLDFGLAKVADPGAISGAPSGAMSPTVTSLGTVAGVLIGTAAYMSPEQARGRPVDRRTDMWSFGCLLYECLTGKQLFCGETVSDSLAAVLRKEPDWDALPSRTPPLVRLFLQRSLTRDPAKRAQDAGDARVELEHAIEDPESSSLGLPAATSAADAAGTGPRWLPWGVALAAVVVAVAAIAMTSRSGGQDEGSRSRRHLTVSIPGEISVGDDGLITMPPAISPDGNLLVTGIAGSDGTTRLALRPLDAFGATPLEGTEGANFPFWSPDSKQLGFFRGGKLVRFELATGRAQTIATSGGLEARGGTWSRDGQILFVKDSNSPVLLTDVTGSDPVQVTRIDDTIPDCSHRWPAFLPDGKHFVFTLWTNDLEARARYGGVYVASIDGGEPTKLLPDASRARFAPPDRLLYFSGGSLVWSRLDLESMEIVGDPQPIAEGVTFDGSTGHASFTVSEENTLVYDTNEALRPARLFWYERDGRRTALDDVVESYLYVRLAPDARRAAVVMFGDHGDGEIRVTDLRRNVRTRATRLDASEQSPIWSANGDTLYFGSQISGSIDLYTVTADGSGEPRLILEGGGDKSLYDVSPDGRYVAYWPVGLGDPTSDIWIHDTKLDKQYPLVNGQPMYGEFRFSYDGRYGAFVSDEPGRREVFVQALNPTAEGLEAGARWQVSANGGARPMWRKDGRELVYVSGGRHMMSVSIEERDGRLALSRPRELFELAAAAVSGDATADLDRFLIAVAEEGPKEPLRVVLGWMGE